MITIPLEVRQEGVARRGRTLNLSMQGARIELDERLDALPGTPVDVTFELEAQSITVPAVIVRADGFSVEFSEAATVVRAGLRAALVAGHPMSHHVAELEQREALFRELLPIHGQQERLSVVVPIYNEGKVVGAFFDRLREVLDATHLDWECIFVDDGSHDETFQALCAIGQQHSRVRAISLSRNFGHQAALLAGLELAGGTVVVTMDGDLQHPPELIPDLLAKWHEGFDVVNAVRAPTEDGGFKAFTSNAFYRVFNFLSALRLPPGSADFRLLDRHVLDKLLALPERHMFLRGLVQWVGFSAASVPYEAQDRQGGESKFTLGKMIRLAADGIFAFSFFPLRLTFYLGLAALGVCAAVVGYVVYAQIRHSNVPGWSSLLLILSFFSGLQLLMLGVVAEYVGRTLSEVKRRPRYLAKSTFGIEDPVLSALADLRNRKRQALERATREVSCRS